MRPSRTLTLRREALAPLQTAELASVAAGAGVAESHLCHTRVYCDPLSFECGPQTFENCRTVPLNDCLSLNGCIQTQ